jgi:hypothetical protein
MGGRGRRARCCPAAADSPSTGGCPAEAGRLAQASRLASSWDALARCGAVVTPSWLWTSGAGERSLRGGSLSGARGFLLVVRIQFLTKTEILRPEPLGIFVAVRCEMSADLQLDSIHVLLLTGLGEKAFGRSAVVSKDLYRQQH